MKNTLLIFSLLSIFILASFVSAGTNDLVISPISIPANITHNTGSFIINFNVTYTGTNVSGIDVSFSPSISGGVATVSPISAVHLNAGDVKVFSTTVTYPSYQSNSISGRIAASTPASQGSLISFFSFSIPILQSYSLSMASITPLTLSQYGVINVSNSGNIPLSNIALNVSSSFPILISLNNLNLDAGSSQLVNLTTTALSSAIFGNNAITVNAISATQNTQASLSFNAPRSFCSNGPIGNNLTVSRVSIRSDGSDDLAWKPLNSITVKVDVENNGANDIPSVTVALGLFNGNGRNAVKDMTFTNQDEEKVKVGTVTSDGTKSVEYDFQIPADVSIGSYKLAVKAYSTNLGEQKMCGDSSNDLNNQIFQTITIDREDASGKQIAFNNVAFSPSEATCGDTVTMSYNVNNVGDGDQDKVRVNIASRELNISASNEITKGLNQGDSTTQSFTFRVPNGLVSKTYPITLDSDYEYNNGNYRQFSDTQDKEYLQVIGCSVRSASDIANIDTILDSEAIAGQTLKIKATITNLGTSAGLFIINPVGYESWAHLSDVSPTALDLGAGESRSAELTFNVNKDILGDKSLSVQIQSSGLTQQKQMTVSFSNSNNSGAQSLLGLLQGNNTLIWIVGAINLILIILIIIVAVRVSRR